MTDSGYPVQTACGSSPTLPQWGNFEPETLCQQAVMVFRRRSTAQEPEHKAVKAMASGPTDNNNDLTEALQ
jgi:hypothetical protein